MKIMASGPITSWQIDGETMEKVTDFIFLGFKITADGDCSHEIKRLLLHGKKAMTILDSILKSRDITLPTKVRLVKTMFFSVVMYGRERWTIRKAEHQRIDAFQLWCWTRLLRIPWTARRSNQSILKEISPECSLEWLMLRLKLQYFGHQMGITDSLEKKKKKTWYWERFKAGGEGDDGGWDGWMASSIQWPWVWTGSGSWWWTGKPGILQSMGLQKFGHDWVTDLNWICVSAAAAAKSLQSCPTLWDPIGGSPPGSPVPGILQARTLEWIAVSLSIVWKWKVKVKSLSHIWLLATPMTAAHQAPPSMGFSRQEYWSRVSLPSPISAARMVIDNISPFEFALLEHL